MKMKLFLKDSVDLLCSLIARTSGVRPEQIQASYSRDESKPEVAELIARSSRNESPTKDKQVEQFQQQLINKPKKDEGIIYSKFRNCFSHYKETTKICSKERRK